MRKDTGWWEEENPPLTVVSQSQPHESPDQDPLGLGWEAGRVLLLQLLLRNVLCPLHPPLPTLFPDTAPFCFTPELTRNLLSVSL